MYEKFRGQYKTLIGKTEGNRRLGRRRSIGGDNIKKLEKNSVWGCELESSGLVCDPVSSF
jgi:hypothetical protein